jgi:formylglycine-generating enzyme required for sulfatase activity
MVRTALAHRRTWQRDGKEMVLVPEGEFLYGKNKVRIYLPAYWIDKTPVTNVEFARFMETTEYITTAEKTGIGCAKIHEKWEDIRGANWRFPGGGYLGEVSNLEDHPVVQVSWEDAVAYAKWAGKRLPTEQEWEKAARGTDGREYPWGNQEPTHGLCNFNMHEGRTTPVGKYSPQGDSPFGCVDMSGNVWEWTSSEGEQCGRVLRGGGWSHPAEYVRLVLRSIHAPEERYDTDGFRCVSEV